MMFLNSAESALLFWNSNQIYYSYQNGFDVGTMVVLSCNTSVLGSTPDDIIHQVLVSDHGDIVVLMYPSNTLYYSRINQHHLIKLSANEIPGVQHLLFFDSLGRLNSITNNSSVSPYPLALHVAGSVYPEVCKYRHFDHNSTADVYYLDLARQLSLSASLTYPLYYFNTIKVLSSSDKLLKQQVVDKFEYYQGWQTLNRTLIIKSRASLYGVDDYTQQKEGAMADVILEMKPEMTDMSCKLPDAMTVHVSLGCPPGRHLQVHKPTQCQMRANYTIPRSALQNEDGSVSTSSKEVLYNQDIGCPIKTHYKDTFLPAIDLYDGDVLIEEMAANYILWEVHGRADYSYTATMQQAGCQSRAQTWEKMQQSVSDGEQAQEGIWGPHNYRHCFFENMTTPRGDDDLLQPYEILNSTGVNKIVWDTWRNDSIYQFTVLVIDPQYSFCHLQTSFGVSLIGLNPSDAPTTTIMRLSIGLFAILTLSLAFVSYIIFRRKHIEEHELYFAQDDEENGEPGPSGDDVAPSINIFNVARKRHKWAAE
ncbi:cation channel sperm-associated auxiliary subunit epsilon-like [Amphiura filiformis]|uniref:cation channel sperm-associated auxiliary subunit epsilon-like n=1 Tax=Amphiura filiformis TaxID=82378 RepID=UPI003B226D66